MKITINKYQDLSSDKLYEILKLRSEVFVVEQNCAYQDLDNKDQKALHLIVEEKNKIKIDIISDNSLIIPEYIINLQNKTKKTIETIEYFEKLKNLEEQKKKYIYLDKKLKHQLELLNDPELYDDNIKKEYITTKKLVESQKNLLSNLEDKVAFSKNYSPKENVKKVLSDYVSTLEFAEVKKLIHSIIEWIKLEQSKEEGKMGNFFINIK